MGIDSEDGEMRSDTRVRISGNARSFSVIMRDGTDIGRCSGLCETVHMHCGGVDGVRSVQSSAERSIELRVSISVRRGRLGSSAERCVTAVGWREVLGCYRGGEHGWS